MTLGLDDPAGGVAATIACLAGMPAGRWLFVAEARPMVRRYHGDRMA